MVFPLKIVIYQRVPPIENPRCEPLHLSKDYGGAVLAAQWRAAVKEVQKPFVMPD